MNTMWTEQRDAVALTGLFLLGVLALALAESPGAQAQAQPAAAVQSARLDGPIPPGAAQPAASSAPEVATTSSIAAKPTDAIRGIEDPVALAKELEAMKLRIEQLEQQLKERTAADRTPAQQPPATLANTLDMPGGMPASFGKGIAPLPGSAGAPAASAAVSPADLPPVKKEKIAPFSDWDWTWLNGNPRNKDTAFDSKFFTPEIRADVTYNYDFNKPVDNSEGGSSELFRSNEIQLEQLGIGGDFHLDNVRARFMTQFGMYSTATIRNDPSYSKGQWNIADADRYLAEAYAGYHLDVLNGINLDAGIFMSYVGLFSYYNFDNWAYQPSYVSSNTPWFFEGVRIQIFPTPHLKIEPWIINGWQSYGSSNARKGLGGQVKWTPRPWVNILSNDYGLGHDDLYIPNRGRLHTDNSIEIKYFDRPGQTVDKMAFTFTADAGCEFGPSTTTSTGTYLQGVGCHGDTKDANSVGGDLYFGDRLAKTSTNAHSGSIFCGWLRTVTESQGFMLSGAPVDADI